MAKKGANKKTCYLVLDSYDLNSSAENGLNARAKIGAAYAGAAPTGEGLCTSVPTYSGPVHKFECGAVSADTCGNCGDGSQEGFCHMGSYLFTESEYDEAIRSSNAANVPPATLPKNSLNNVPSPKHVIARVEYAGMRGREKMRIHEVTEPAIEISQIQPDGSIVLNPTMAVGFFDYVFGDPTNTPGSAKLLRFYVRDLNDNVNIFDAPAGNNCAVIITPAGAVRFACKHTLVRTLSYAGASAASLAMIIAWVVLNRLNASPSMWLWIVAVLITAAVGIALLTEWVLWVRRRQQRMEMSARMLRMQQLATTPPAK